MMKIKTHHQGNVAVVAIEGKLMGDTSALRAELMKLCEENSRKIVLDLKNVSWANSMGLGDLIACYSHATKVGGEFALARVEDTVEMLLKTTGLDKIFKIYKSLDEAVKDLEKSKPS
jgi:anti-anti-sigma factor